MTMRKSLHIFSSIVVFFTVILMILIAGVKLVGIEPYIYSDGSIIYVKPTEPSEIEVGDTITYILNEDNHIATNKVYSINEEKRFFYIKASDLSYGDASNSDANGTGSSYVPISFDDLIGKTIITIPLIGHIAVYVSQKTGFTVAIAFIVFFLLMMTCTMPPRKQNNAPLIEQEPAESNDDSQDKTKEEKPDENEIQTYRRMPSATVDRKFSRTADLSGVRKDTDKKSKQ